jgi:hypothetical protein
LIYIHWIQTNKTAIKQDNEETVLFNSEAGFTDLKIAINSKNLDISNAVRSKEFELPLDELRNNFHSVLKGESILIAKTGRSKYMSHMGSGTKMTLVMIAHLTSPFLPPSQQTKLVTRSSSWAKHRTENLDQHLMSRKRKGSEVRNILETVI